MTIFLQKIIYIKTRKAHLSSGAIISMLKCSLCAEALVSQQREAVAPEYNFEDLHTLESVNPESLRSAVYKSTNMNEHVIYSTEVS